MSSEPICLNQLKLLGAGVEFAEQLHKLFSGSWLFKALEDQGADGAEILIKHLAIYQADPGQPLLLEGELSNFMLIIVEGEVDIVKRDSHGAAVSISHAGAGKILGEMSLMDGEPRFASCIALQATTIAVLTRLALNRILDEHPRLGAQLLIQLIALLSQRLRHTSRKLVEQMS